MYFADFFNKLSFLIITCFSFFILNFTFTMNKDRTLLKTLGASFFAPFLLSCASFLQSNALIAEALVILSQLSLLFIILLILLIKPGPKSHSFFIALTFSIPIILLILVFNFNDIPAWIVIPQLYVTLIALFTLANMFLLRKAKDSKSLLFWAMLFTIAGNIVAIYGDTNFIGFMSAICIILTYTLFYIYFYKNIYNKINKKINEADQKLTSYDRSVEVEVRKRVYNIERSNEKLVSISKTDSLTKSINKAAIFETMEKLITSKSSDGFCILMFDIDNFKGINDQLGHLEGDKCLKRLALMAKSSIRESDSIGRYGGDEFIIILPSTSILQAKLVAEKFRKRVESTDSPHYSVSIGVASFPQDGITVKELISVADEGLYLSKKKGKNAVSHRDE